MDDIIEVEDSTEQISLARCRELLGDESTERSDAELNAIREHAQMMANVLVELFLAGNSQS